MVRGVCPNINVIVETVAIWDKINKLFKNKDEDLVLFMKANELKHKDWVVLTTRKVFGGGRQSVKRSTIT